MKLLATPVHSNTVDNGHLGANCPLQAPGKGQDEEGAFSWLHIFFLTTRSQ